MRLVWDEKLALWIRVGGGATIAMTLSACYGGPMVDDIPMKTEDAKTQTLPVANETLGGLSLGMADTEIVKLLGEAGTKQGNVWTYPDRGLEIVIGPGGIERLKIEAPSKLATSQGVTIGTPRAEVDAKHGTQPAGVSFEYTAGAVSSIVIE